MTPAWRRYYMEQLHARRRRVQYLRTVEQQGVTLSNLDRADLRRHLAVIARYEAKLRHEPEQAGL